MPTGGGWGARSPIYAPFHAAVARDAAMARRRSGAALRSDDPAVQGFETVCTVGSGLADRGVQDAARADLRARTVALACAREQHRRNKVSLQPCAHDEEADHRRFPAWKIAAVSPGGREKNNKKSKQGTPQSTEQPTRTPSDIPTRLSTYLPTHLPIFFSLFFVSLAFVLCGGLFCVLLCLLSVCLRCAWVHTLSVLCGSCVDACSHSRAGFPRARDRSRLTPRSPYDRLTIH
jgi:hypothetical protein